MRAAAIFFMALAIAGAHPAGAQGEARVPIVRRGDRLILDSKVGAVTASVPAEAMQDGGKGDTIRVKNLQSGKVQPAQIVRAGLAEVAR